MCPIHPQLRLNGALNEPRRSSDNSSGELEPFMAHGVCLPKSRGHALLTVQTTNTHSISFVNTVIFLLMNLIQEIVAANTVELY